MASDIFPLSAALSVFSTLFDNVTNPGMNLIDRNYRVLWANKGMSVAARRPLKEMLGKPCYQAFLKRNEPCEPCMLKVVSQTGEPYVGERIVDLHDGTKNLTHVRAYPIFDSMGLQYVIEIVMPSVKKEGQRRVYLNSLEKALRELAPGSAARAEEAARDEGLPVLTPREIEVLRLLAKGFSNTEIGRILSMSPNTAKTHIRNIFERLQVADRTEAAVWAARHNLL